MAATFGQISDYCSYGQAFALYGDILCRNDVSEFYALQGDADTYANQPGMADVRIVDVCTGIPGSWHFLYWIASNDATFTQYVSILRNSCTYALRIFIPD